MTLREQLLTVATAYCLFTGRSESRVSTQVLSGGKRLQQIRDGGDIGTVGFERAMVWFSENWPSEQRWPDGVTRPLRKVKITEAAE